MIDLSQYKDNIPLYNIKRIRIAEILRQVESDLFAGPEQRRKKLLEARSLMVDLKLDLSVIDKHLSGK